MTWSILKCAHVILIPDLNGSKLSCCQSGERPETLMFWTRTCCSVVKAGWAQQELESEQTWPSGGAAGQMWTCSSAGSHLDRDTWIGWPHPLTSLSPGADLILSSLEMLWQHFACILRVFTYIWKAAPDSKISRIPFWPLAFIVQSVLALYLIQNPNKTPHMPLQCVVVGLASLASTETWNVWTNSPCSVCLASSSPWRKSEIPIYLHSWRI